MIAVPFIYFSLLVVLLCKKNKGIDIATIIAAEFAITGFFSILMSVFNLMPDNRDYQITPWATITYCGLLTICLLPFILFSNAKIKYIRPIKNELLFKALAIISLLWFIIRIILTGRGIMEILTGDINELRHDVYSGEESIDYYWGLPGPIRKVMELLGMVFGCSWIFIFLAFFSLTIQKLPIRYFWMFLITSLSGPWAGILGVDRSKAAYWIISVVVMALFFRPFIDKKNAKPLIVAIASFVGLLIVYLGLVTSSRFGDRYYSEVGGNEGGMIVYFGQNFPNFCFFYDTFHSSWKTLSLIFPFTQKYLFRESIVGGVNIQQVLDQITGLKTGVFYTYLGQILITAGKIVMFLYVLFFFVATLFVNRKVQSHVVSAEFCFFYLFFASIMFLGLFVHYYSSPTLTFSIISFFVLITLLRDKPVRVFRKKKIKRMIKSEHGMPNQPHSSFSKF